MTHHSPAPPSLATSPVVQICTLSFQSAEDGSEDPQQQRILAAIHLVRLTYRSEGSFAPFLTRRPITASRHDSATCKANCHHMVPSEPGILFAISPTVMTNHYRAG